MDEVNASDDETTATLSEASIAEALKAVDEEPVDVEFTDQDLDDPELLAELAQIQCGSDGIPPDPATSVQPRSSSTGTSSKTLPRPTEPSTVERKKHVLDEKNEQAKKLLSQFQAQIAAIESDDADIDISDADLLAELESTCNDTAVTASVSSAPTQRREPAMTPVDPATLPPEVLHEKFKSRLEQLVHVEPVRTLLACQTHMRVTGLF